MLNSHRLKKDFVEALQKYWSPDAIWSECRNGYREGISHPSYGQCLVGTLATWVAHDVDDSSFKIVPGILRGDNIPEAGVWHFQLNDCLLKGEIIPVDVTWDQAEKGVFMPVSKRSEPDLYQAILQGSFPEDETLVSRLGVILSNLERQNYPIAQSAEDIVMQAYEHLSL